MPHNIKLQFIVFVNRKLAVTVGEVLRIYRSCQPVRLYMRGFCPFTKPSHWNILDLSLLTIELCNHCFGFLKSLSRESVIHRCKRRETLYRIML